MRRFSDLNITSPDGKKMFNCKTVSITDIVNCEIEVHDFVADVKTLHGTDRMVIKVVVDGEEAKFFTNCQQIKNTMLAACENDLPFIATIRKVKTGNSTSYKFT